MIGCTWGEVNTELHAVIDSVRRPIGLFLTAGQVSDYVDARVRCEPNPVC